jgi:hypothetical protein
MNLDIVESVFGYPIRLTDERWYEHIVVKREYMSGYYEAVLDAIVNPEFVLPADDGSMVAVLNLGKDRWLHVFYIEYLNDDGERDGFISTAYIKRKYNKRAKKLWQRNS